MTPDLVSQNVFINEFWKVNSPTKSSTYCLLLLIQTLICRFCWGVDSPKLIDKCIVPDKMDAGPEKGSTPDTGAESG